MGKKSKIATSFSVAFLDWINFVLAGNIPIEIGAFFAGAKLIALKKPDGGVRPIAIGEVWRRVAAKVAAKLVQVSTKDIFGDLQMGINTSNGCEKIIHNLNALVDSGALQDQVLAKIDWRNAFNTCDRIVLFNAVRAHLPSLSKFVESCYLGQPNLFYHDTILKSAKGVQQGDPLAPLLFCLVQHDLVLAVERTFKPLYNCWYMDDGNVILPLYMVDNFFNLLKTEGFKIGLELNILKCEIWAPNLTYQLSRLITPITLPLKLIETSGIEVLGGPLSTDPNFVKELFSIKKSKVLELIDKLLSLDNSQNQLLLLRSCIAYPQMGFHIRVCPPSYITNELSEYDDIIREAISLICGTGLDDLSKMQLALPISEGGLGFQSISKIALAAFLASVASAFDGKQVRSEFYKTVDCYQILTKEVDENLAIDKLHSTVKLQKSLSKPLRDLDVAAFELELSNCTDSVRRLAHWNSVKSNCSAKVFVAIPWNRSRIIQRDIFAAMIRSHLAASSLPLSASNSIKCIHCGTSMDRNSSHDLDCKSNGVVKRHNSVRDCLASLCVSAGFGIKVEKSGLSMRTRERPADIFVTNWKDGKDLWIDVAVVNPLCPSNIRRSSLEKNSALNLAEKRKLDNYTALVQENGNALFVPFICDVFGGLNKSAEDLLVRLASITATREAENQKKVLSENRLKLSFKILSQVANQLVSGINVRSTSLSV
jgi:hypothetical protein